MDGQWALLELGGGTEALIAAPARYLDGFLFCPTSHFAVGQAFRGEGGLIVAVSTIVVALNAQLLRRLDLRPDTIVPTADVPRGAGADQVTVGHR